MSPEPLNEFLKVWEDFPEEQRGCFSDAKLVEIAKETDPAQWPKHVKTCRYCKEVVNLLRVKQSPTRLYQFLDTANQTVTSGMTERPKWEIPSMVRIFSSLGHPRWVTAALALALAVFATTWFMNSRSVSFENADRAAVVSLAADDYAIAVDWLQESVDQLNSPDRSTKELQARAVEFNKDVPAINKRLAELAGTELQPGQRAELAKLVTAYNSKVTLLKQPPSTEPNLPPRLAPTGDSEVVASIYTKANRTLNQKKVDEEIEEDDPQKEMKTALAAENAARQIDIVSIDESEVKIVDLMPNREPEQKLALETDIANLLKSRNMHPTFLSASTRTSAFAPSKRLLIRPQ